MIVASLFVIFSLSSAFPNLGVEHLLVSLFCIHGLCLLGFCSVDVLSGSNSGEEVSRTVRSDTEMSICMPRRLYPTFSGVWGRKSRQMLLWLEI